MFLLNQSARRVHCRRSDLCDLRHNEIEIYEFSSNCKKNKVKNANEHEKVVSRLRSFGFSFNHNFQSHFCSTFRRQNSIFILTSCDLLFGIGSAAFWSPLHLLCKTEWTSIAYVRRINLTTTKRKDDENFMICLLFTWIDSKHCVTCAHNSFTFQLSLDAFCSGLNKRTQILW